MLLKNNENRVHHLGESIRLNPGVNEVDAKAWSEAKKIEVVQHLLKAKAIEEVQGEEAQQQSEGGSSSGSLASMPENKAVELVTETVDRDLLNRWKGEDGRPEVQQALDTQLEAVRLTEEEKAASGKGRRR